MHLLHPIALTLSWLLAFLWIAKALETSIGLPKIPNLALPQYDLTPPGAPTLTVIVPARNEAANIAATLQTLLAQDLPGLHIITIDDRSTDTTGILMDTLAAQHPTRLTVLHVTELPPSWLGKTHAMALAARHAIASATPPGYLLFTDADILFAPTILRRALAAAIAARADHFVTMPTTLIHSPGEAAVLTCFHIVSMLSVRLWRVPDPASRDAIGVGAFNLLRTPAYLAVGGFDALRMEIVEDLTLGRNIKRAGLRQAVATAPGMVAVHWATGAFGILHGLTKNFFAVFRYRTVVLLLATAMLTATCLAPYVLVFTPGLRLPGALALAGVLAMGLLSTRHSSISRWYIAAFPLSAALIVYAILRSLAVTLTQGGVTWRGTFYPLATLRKNAR